MKKLACITTKTDGKILGNIDPDNSGLNNQNLISISNPTSIHQSPTFDPWETSYFEGDLKKWGCDEVWIPMDGIVSLVPLRKMPELFARLWGLEEV